MRGNSLVRASLFCFVDPYEKRTTLLPDLLTGQSLPRVEEEAHREIAQMFAEMERLNELMQTDSLEIARFRQAGWLFDGAHRVMKAYALGLTQVRTVRFIEDPEPDYRKKNETAETPEA